MLQPPIVVRLELELDLGGNVENKHECRTGNWVIMHAVAANASIKADDLIRRLEKKRKKEAD